MLSWGFEALLSCRMASSLYQLYIRVRHRHLGPDGGTTWRLSNRRADGIHTRKDANRTLFQLLLLFSAKRNHGKIELANETPLGQERRHLAEITVEALCPVGKHFSLDIRDRHII